MAIHSIILLSAVIGVVNAYGTVHHRHRHSRSHSANYDLDSLMNRIESYSPSTTTAKPPIKENIFDDFDEPVTDSNSETENSLWDDDFVMGTKNPSLDSDDFTKIMKANRDKEQQQEELEDAEDEVDERSEEALEDEQEQGDSAKLNSRDSYTQWKWDNLGNRKSMDNLFQVYRSGLLKPDLTNKESMAQYEVYRHNKQMSRETMCKVPRPKVIKVSDIYPSTSKLYVPPCTILHQCSDDTGCCGGSSQKCGPKTTKRVELYFYTTYIVSSHSRQRTSSGLEKLPFYNHTECECQDKLEEVMPRDGLSGDYRNERNSEHSCKCPSEYTVRRLANGSCTCDCFDKQRDCIKYKKGKEYFNHNDRLCIEMGTCQLPACDFGVYMRSSGRCPRKHEKLRTWSRYHH